MRYSTGLLCIVIVLFSSCSERLYYPNRANVPAFREAQEAKAVFSMKPNNNLSLQAAGDAAYSPINHLGVIASYRGIVNRDAYLYPVYDKPENYSYNNTMVTVNGHLLEAGAGYFTRLEDHVIFEVYGGGGSGVVKSNGRFTARYNRVFLQTDCGFRNNVVSAMWGVRAAMEKYYSFLSGDPVLRYTINTSEPSQRTRYDLLAQHFLFIDPYMNFEVGYKYVAFNAQLGVSLQASHNSAIGSDFPVYVSFGVAFHFAPSFMKKRKA